MSPTRSRARLLPALLALALALVAALGLAARVALADDATTPSYLSVDESSKTITVSDDESDTSTNEIQDAINYIAKYYATGDYVGDWTIVVSGGTYSRFFISEKYATALEGLTVEAADDEEVVIGVFDDSETPTGVDGETLTYNSTPDVGGVYVNVTGVTLSGLTFQYGTSTGYTQWYASAISTFNNQAGCKVYELTISDCDFYGQGDRYGFMVCDVKVWTIEGCTFDNLTAGISFMEDGSAIQATIANNTFTNCDDAILESYAGGTPTEGVSYYLTITGNTFTGTAAEHTRVCIMNEYKDVDSLGTVTISGNTFEHANILLDCIDTTADEVYKNNTFGECSWVLVTSFSHVSTSITDSDKVVTFYASTDLGYWELTSTDGISTDDLAYLQGLIAEANKNGSTTLTIDMGELDLTGSSLSGYLSGGVKHLKKVLNWVTTTTLEVTKVWDDEDDADGIRPDSVTVELCQNGEATGFTATLSEDSKWTATFDSWSEDYKGLPVHSEDGTTDYTYSVVETAVAGYETSYSDVTGSNEDGWAVTVTNTHEYVTVDVTVSKVWDDDDDADELRPDSVTVELYADGEATGLTVELSEDNGWTATFEGLAAYSYDDDCNATEVAYTVEEVAVEGYSASLTGVSFSLGTLSVEITNTHEVTVDEPVTVSIAVEKEWDDDGDAEGLRPESVTIELYADGVATGETVVLSEANGWCDAFTGLDAYDEGGEEIAYAIAEVDVPDGYAVSYSDFSGSVDEGGYSITVTNALVEEAEEEATTETETTEETTEEEAAEVPDTGDATTMTWAAAAVAGLAAVAGALALRRRARR